jgi:predicted nucleotidyltransferase
MTSNAPSPPRADLRADLRRALEAHPEVELALLFGSRARGEGRDEATGGFEPSDADVAVEGDDLDLLGLAADLSRAAGVEVHIADLRRAGYVLLRAILRDGVLLFEGVPHAEARFRTRAILQTEMDRPYFERMNHAFLARLAEQADG